MSTCPSCGHTSGGVKWPAGYLNAESRYCAKESEEFYACDVNSAPTEKARLRKILLDKRETFKEVWKYGYSKEESSKEESCKEETYEYLPKAEEGRR